MKILVADIDSTTRWFLYRGLKGYGVVECATFEEARFILRNSRFDVVFLSRNFPDGDGFELIKEFRDVNFVVITANPAIDNVSKALRLGAVAYLKKPLELSKVRELVERLKAPAEPVSEEVVLYSLPVRSAVERMEAYAEEGVPFLVYGEPGVGKRTLVAYVAKRNPQLEMVLLDSMCLCRQREIYNGIVSGDVSHCKAFILSGDPEYAFASDRLHEGIYNIISSRAVEIKPLRERREEIPFLVDHFRRLWEKSNGGNAPAFTDEAMDLLKGYSWSGNVSELREVVLGTLDRYGFLESIDVEHLPTELYARAQGFTFVEVLRRDIRNAIGSKEDLHERLIEVVERVLLEEALSITKGNKIKAAQLTGLHRNTIRNKIKKLFGGKAWT